MSRDLDLEQRYRRVLRLLPGYYRQQWEDDMVGTFLDGWLTGDAETDEYISKAARPEWAEIASVACLAARLYLGGAGTPRRFFAWGQAVRRAVLAVVLVHAVLGLDVLVRTAWSHRPFGLPAPPAFLTIYSPGGVWATVYYEVNVAWIVIFVALVLGHYRTARVLAVYRIASLTEYLHDPHMIAVGLGELLILGTAAALVAPDAARAQAATPAPPANPHPMAA